MARRIDWHVRMSALGLLLVIVLAGCGPDTGGRVGASGKVTFKGTPLASGAIEFASADNSVRAGTTITNGEYNVPAAGGLAPGSYIVRITSAKEGAAAAADALPGPEAEKVVTKEEIPAEWNVNSTQKVEVTADGSNQFDFTIP